MKRDKTHVEPKFNIKEGDYLNASQLSAVKPVYDLFVQNFEDFYKILRSFAGYQYSESRIETLNNSKFFPTLYQLVQNQKGEYLRNSCSAANDLANSSPKIPIDAKSMWGLKTLFNAAVEFNEYAIHLNKKKEDSSGNIAMSMMVYGCYPIKKKELEKYIAIAEKFITAFSAPNKSLRFLETECSKIDRLNKKNQKQDELNAKAGLDDDMRLAELVGTAISTDQNFVLTKSQIDIVKKAIGEQEFESAIKAYKLKEADLTLDNVRMLVIRFLAHQPAAQWLENKFINSVIKWCNLEQKQGSDNIGTLVETIRYNPKIWKAIGKEPRNNLISKALNFICKILPARWKFLTSLRFKTNDAFRADFDEIKEIHKKGDNKFFFSATSQVKKTTK